MDHHGHGGGCEVRCSCDAQHTAESQCHCDVGHASGGAVTVTVNPEARVSVVCSLDNVPVADRDGSISIGVTIVNSGFVTMPLEAMLLEPSPPMVSVDFAADPLTGSGMEHRLLVVTVPDSGLVDITIGFRLLQEEPDLGGRDRFHFLASGAVAEVV